jgi:hypothetical protein
MWLLGPTPMIIASVIITTLVVCLDRWNPKAPERHFRAVEGTEEASASKSSPAEQQRQEPCVPGGAGGPNQDVEVVMISNRMTEHRTVSAAECSYAPRLGSGGDFSVDTKERGSCAGTGGSDRLDAVAASTKGNNVFDEDSEVFSTANETPRQGLPPKVT